MIKHVPNIACKNAPCVILVRPQMAENIGMTARAMMNTGLSELRLVLPRENHLSETAIRAASGADAILTQAHVFKTLNEALSDIGCVMATTARRRGMTKPVFSPKEGITHLAEQAVKGSKTAVLFGAERTGLENTELINTDGIIEIPLNPLHCSLNLSQAVLLIGYEYYQNIHPFENTHLETNGAPIATKAELDIFLNTLETELKNRSYFRFPTKEERMRRNLRNIFTRNQLTQSEIKTLYSVIRDLTQFPKISSADKKVPFNE